MERQCIICLNDKHVSLFNQEHIFPAAVGGHITISTVCQVCNTKLGNKVDTPFCNNNLILHFRNVLEIGRPVGPGTTGTRSVKNPFQGLFTDKKGSKFRVDWEGPRPVPIPIPQVTFDYLEDGGLKINLTGLKQEDASNQEKINKIVKESARREGIEVKEYFLHDTKIDQPDNLQIKFDIDNDSLVLGCVKIAYEVTCSVFPFYVTDPIAFMIRKSLRKGKLDYHLAKTLKDNHNLQEYFTKKFSQIKGVGVGHHGIMMEVLPKYGLVCAVRFFNQVYPVTVSTTFFPIKEGHELFVYNDIFTKTGGSNVVQEFPVVNISVELAGIPADIKETILDRNEGYFITDNGKIPVYDKTGKVLYEDLELMCIDLVQKESTRNFVVQSDLRYEVSSKNYYLKTPEGILVKVLYVIPQRRVSLRKVII